MSRFIKNIPMPKINILLLSLLLAGTCLAQDQSPVAPTPVMPPVAPMPVLPAPLSHSLNSALYPIGRFDWFQRVETNIEKGKQAAATCELVFDGDSITDSWQTMGKDVWAQHYAKYNAFDFGIAGDQTQHLLWRLSQGQAQGMHPKLIVLLIGTNNIVNYTPGQISEAVNAILQAYQKICPDAVILLQGIFPRGEKPEDPLRSKIKQANEIISKLGDGKKVIYLDFGDKFLQPDGTISREIMPDFLHPGIKGFQIWADAIQPIVDRYLPAK